MVESLSNNADKSDVDAEVEDHRATDVHDEPQPPDGKGEAGGVAELDDNGTVRSGQVPSLAVTDTFTAENESDLTGLSDAEIGDVGIVSSNSLTYILTGDYDVQDNWVEFETPPAPVDDVNGQTGSVTLGAGDVDAEPSGAVEDHRTDETHETAQPPETHGNAAHNATFAEDGDAQPPENHGNGAHNVTFAEDGDAQPPENHGNGAHSVNYLDSNDYDPESDTHDRYTDAEAEAAAPVQDVNGQQGSVSLSASTSAPPDSPTTETEIWQKFGVNDEPSGPKTETYEFSESYTIFKAQAYGTQNPEWDFEIVSDDGVTVLSGTIDSDGDSQTNTIVPTAQNTSKPYTITVTDVAEGGGSLVFRGTFEEKYLYYPHDHQV